MWGWGSLRRLQLGRRGRRRGGPGPRPLKARSGPRARSQVGRASGRAPPAEAAAASQGPKAARLGVFSLHSPNTQEITERQVTAHGQWGGAGPRRAGGRAAGAGRQGAGPAGARVPTRVRRRRGLRAPGRGRCDPRPGAEVARSSSRRLRGAARAACRLPSAILARRSGPSVLGVAASQLSGELVAWNLSLGFLEFPEASNARIAPLAAWGTRGSRPDLFPGTCSMLSRAEHGGGFCPPNALKGPQAWFLCRLRPLAPCVLG